MTLLDSYPAVEDALWRYADAYQVRTATITTIPSGRASGDRLPFRAAFLDRLDERSELKARLAWLDHEEQVVVLRLLAAQQEAGKVTVRIGHDTEAEEMAGTSVVTTAYGSMGKVYGGMGVLGPTRMDYPGTIANVAAVAMYIGEVLGNR